mmetsp:Transcript_46821/g.92143  ORF Transcript_46821/g.92143 Transcript_46821/m.92143 type:complete len:323 (-) Transcript_46821:192-1160(-)
MGEWTEGNGKITSFHFRPGELQSLLLQWLLSAVSFRLVYHFFRRKPWFGFPLCCFKELPPFFSQLSPKDQTEWASCVVSMLHCCIALVGGYWILCVDDGGGFTDPHQAVFGNTDLRNGLLMVTCGYMLHDFILCTSTGIAGVMVLLHHIFIMAAFLIGVFTGFATFYMGCFLVNELSTLFLNGNFFMACNPEWKAGLCYKLNAVALLLSFTAVRVVFNLYVTFHILTFSWGRFFFAWWSNLGQTFSNPAWWQRLTDQFGIPLESDITYPPFAFLLVFCLTALAIGHVLLNLIWYMRLLVAARRKLLRPHVHVHVNSNKEKTN